LLKNWSFIAHFSLHFDCLAKIASGLKMRGMTETLLY